LGIDSQTGVISGSATDFGAFTATISVASADGQTKAATIPIFSVPDVAGTYSGDVQRWVDTCCGFSQTSHHEQMTATVLQDGDVLDISVASGLTSAADTVGKKAILNDSPHSFHMTAQVSPTNRVTQLSFDNPSLACPGSLGLDGTFARFGPVDLGNGPLFAFIVRFGEFDCHATTTIFREMLDGILTR
jgi:hypothetical protein